MGAGVISPSSVPYGIDPNLVDVSTLNVNYTYDNNYQGATADNALWYKTGAILASANGQKTVSKHVNVRISSNKQCLSETDIWDV